MSVYIDTLKTRIWQYQSKEMTAAQVVGWAREEAASLLASGKLFELDAVAAYAFLTAVAKADGEDALQAEIELMNRVFYEKAHFRHVVHMRIPGKFQDTQTRRVRESLLRHMEGTLTAAEAEALERFARNTPERAATVQAMLSERIASCLLDAYFAQPGMRFGPANAAFLDELNEKEHLQRIMHLLDCATGRAPVSACVTLVGGEACMDLVY